MISTQNLALFPDPDNLRRLLQSLAMLDAIIEEEWDLRYYSFNANWATTEQMGSMRNGSGDDFFAVFVASGCFLRGFDHRAVMSPYRVTPSKIWPGVLDGVPAQLQFFLKEPAFHMEDTTFCVWRLAGDAEWSHGPIKFSNKDDPDGSQWMLSALDLNPKTYQLHAKEYYELDVALDAIARVYSHEPLSRDLVRAFPSSRKLKDIRLDAREIGYPINV